MADTPLSLIENIRENYAQYLTKLGQVAHGWNALQETLGGLFAILLSGVPQGISLAIWYSEQNDRAQRRLLRAAVDAGALEQDKLPKVPASAKSDILWLLEKADKLGSRRDEALHAPIDIDFSKPNPDIIAAYYQGNPLATRLKDKDLLDEFDVSAYRCGMLRQYAESMKLALTDQASPWPRKHPSLDRQLPHQRAE